MKKRKPYGKPRGKSKLDWAKRSTGGAMKSVGRVMYERKRMGKLGPASGCKRIEVSDEEKARLIALVGGGV